MNIIFTETPISHRLKDGTKSTLTEVNMDLSEKILDYDFDSNDNT